MDKKFVYALLGGAAIIGAAVAYHLFSKSSEEAEGDLDADLDELGPLELDENGRIKFEQFLKIF
jgi:hypothetical protein